ncbi:short-chain dehydrogenase [Filobasidium floriforme]|uniref:short-chain dehydrogenase n=1 Tax=Filobasidium floriforme TaxID=5210 RepID=UPI001E8C9E4F|nr:short-chain dehydrogenase [Filobasidium floriforme]KAH8081805.1 short-chain dehydrogenase [Filobasidium floriforme]
MSFSPVIIVTGASKGLGLAITQILLSTFNAKIVAVSRSIPQELETLRSSSDHKERVEIVQGDVVSDETSAHAVKVALERFGRIDGLVLNAGTIDPLGPIADPENTIAQWASTFQINLFSLVSMLQHATPHLRSSENGGKVVMVSSGAATGNTSGWGCYNSSKAALNSLCRTYANEEKSITSFAVRPGMVNTEMQTKLRALGEKGMNPEELERFTTAHKEGKLLKPEDPGFVIAALAVKGHEVKELSGQFLSWNEASLSAYQRPQ